MGTLRSTTDEVKGYAYNGVVLGQPSVVSEDPEEYVFDDSSLPNGTVELVDGELVVIVDVEEVDGS